RLGGGLGIGSSAANGRNSRVRLDHIALAAEQKRLLFIGNEQQGLQMAQKFVGTPVFGEFDRRAANIAVVLLQLGLKAAEKRKSVGGGTRESRQDLLLIQPTDLARVVLNHTLTKRDLSVPGHDNAAIAADAKNCSGANQTFRRHAINLQLYSPCARAQAVATKLQIFCRENVGWAEVTSECNSGPVPLTRGYNSAPVLDTTI